MRPQPIRWRWRASADIGRISIYAQGEDYHDVVKKALKTLARWIVAEAGRATQGVHRYRTGDGKAARRRRRPRLAGQHTNLVSGADGSWLLLGAILTTLEMEGTSRHPHRIAELLGCLTPVRRMPSRRRSGSMPGGASPTSRSSIRGQSPPSSGGASATASTVATTAWPSARGTSSPPRPTENRAFARAPNSSPRPRRLLALDDAGFRQSSPDRPSADRTERMIRNALSPQETAATWRSRGRGR